MVVLGVMAMPDAMESASNSLNVSHTQGRCVV